MKTKAFCAVMTLALHLMLTSSVSAAALYSLSGLITDAENLAFAVVNGELLVSNPEPEDLPLEYQGLLSIDSVAETASFEFEGSFSSPDRSYDFEWTFEDLWDGLTVNDGASIVITDDFDDFDFSLALNLLTGLGTWSFLEPEAVPTDPAQGAFADASILQVSQVPVPAALWLLGSGIAGLWLHSAARGRKTSRRIEA